MGLGRTVSIKFTASPIDITGSVGFFKRLSERALLFGAEAM